MMYNPLDTSTLSIWLKATIPSGDSKVIEYELVACDFDSQTISLVSTGTSVVTS